ncbi:glycosyltransferase [uncultured Shimia sp.]|uniref:glycosyltransferase n=1 Tax=uncultured Shimia sp. TaxID=573152 RepID=UPI0026101B4B|nr:glycosyltransferase [uncultured Shimia sp.]
MTLSEQVTICITMGLRPKNLRRTLQSLGPELLDLPIISINDFGDAPTNAVFDSLCSDGVRIDLGQQVGHHRAVDAMYQHVTTPYVLHLEDDWVFSRSDFLPDAIKLLRANASIGTVCVLKLSDFDLTKEKLAKIPFDQSDSIRFARLDTPDDKCHEFTFNPHIAPLTLWQDLGGYGNFKRESYLSRKLLSEGRFAAYLDPGACHHIGRRSVSYPKQAKAFQRALGWFRRGPK